MRASRLMLFAAIAAGLVVACGGGGGTSTPTPTPTPAPTPTNPQPTGFFITISGMRFSPQNLDVPPGATVTVINQDSSSIGPHSATSESQQRSFTSGAVAGISFDTKPFTGQTTFTIPSTAAEGTVVPYFCTVHTSTMANNPDPTITIRAAAQPGPNPTTGTGGGG